MQVKEAFSRDANNVPITTDGLVTSDIQTLSGNNTTVNVPIFTIQGSVEVRGLWGVVTTVLGANNTAAYWGLNDQTNQSNITLNTGTTLSAAPVGSLIVKKGLAAAALTLLSASQERVSEPTTLETPYFSPFVVVALPSATTNIEFTYSTTDTPTSGVIQFFLRWLPLTNNANVIAL
jgi:hypothetical protein